MLNTILRVKSKCQDVNLLDSDKNICLVAAQDKHVFEMPVFCVFVRMQLLRASSLNGCDEVVASC